MKIWRSCSIKCGGLEVAKRNKNRKKKKLYWNILGKRPKRTRRRVKEIDLLSTDKWILIHLKTDFLRFRHKTYWTWVWRIWKYEEEKIIKDTSTKIYEFFVSGNRNRTYYHDCNLCTLRERFFCWTNNYYRWNLKRSTSSSNKKC